MDDSAFGVVTFSLEEDYLFRSKYLLVPQQHLLANEVNSCRVALTRSKTGLSARASGGRHAPQLHLQTQRTDNRMAPRTGTTHTPST